MSSASKILKKGRTIKTNTIFWNYRTLNKTPSICNFVTKCVEIPECCLRISLHDEPLQITEICTMYRYTIPNYELYDYIDDIQQIRKPTEKFPDL